MGDYCTVVAECGVNHMGSLDTALRLCDAAKDAQADVAKFQTFLPSQSIKADSPDYDKLAALALPLENFRTIAKHCEDIDLEFMSTPDDLDSMKFLVEECGVRRIKLGSGSLTYRPLVRAAFATGLPVILSTGMATSFEVMTALLDSSGPEKVTLLHCVSLYPCPPELVNLRAMDSLRVFGTKVGYSDHTWHIAAVMAAAAMGADVIEKHLMMRDGGDGSIDAAVSIGPNQFIGMVCAIRRITLMRGEGLKRPSEQERAMIPKIRKDETGRQPGL